MRRDIAWISVYSEVSSLAPLGAQFIYLFAKWMHLVTLDLKMKEFYEG